MGRNLLFVIFLLISTAAFAQKAEELIPQLLDSAQTYQFSNYDKANQLAANAEKLIRQAGVSAYPAALIRSYRIRITSNRYFARPQLVKKYLDEAEASLKQFKRDLGQEYFSLRIEIKISRAGYLQETENYDGALALFLEILDEIKQLPSSSENCLKLYRTMQYIALIHRIKGEFESSINQYLASIPYFDCYEDSKYPPDYSLVFRNVGMVFLAKQDFKNAREYLFRARDSLQVFWNRSNNKSAPATTGIVLAEALATFYRKQEQHDSCLYVLRDAEKYIKYSKPFQGRYYLSLGEAYEGTGNHALANDFYDKAISFFLNVTGDKGTILSEAYLAKGRFLEKQGFAEEAVGYFQKAIASLMLNGDLKSLDNPVLVNILSKKHLFSALQAKARLLEKSFHQTKQFNNLKQAFETNQLLLSLLDSTANEYSLDQDKIILTEQSYSAFEDGIRMSSILYQETHDDQYFNNIISLIEKSKGILLLENLRMVNRFSGIRQEWFEKERELKSQLLLAEQAIYDFELTPKKSDNLQNLRIQYEDIKRDYSKLISQIKREAPDYYKLRFDHSVISVRAIQHQLLKPNEALIEFFVGDSILAIVGFTNQRKYTKVKAMLPDFSEKMNQFRVMLTTGSPDFFQYSKEFFDFLLKDCLAELRPEVKSLIIIPDGLLGYLPFEVLMQPQGSKISFLNEHFTIRYAHSATYLTEQMQRKASDSKNFFAGFVSPGSGPVANRISVRGQKFVPLQGAAHEVTSIAELFNSKFTIFNPAHKIDFINHAAEYQILHFAMHSSLHDENPMMSVMVFSDGDSSENLLTAIELYGMKLNSELAVLSACNTGMGQLHRGEGVMSFSRAFAYAGVASAVISLWKVPDVATSKMMVNFYQYLKAGEPKDRALQLARHDFIRDNPAMDHPYYWSGFILTGKNDPLSFPGANQWMWIMGGSAILLAAVFVGRKKIGRVLRKSSTSSTT